MYCSSHNGRVSAPLHAMHIERGTIIDRNTSGSSCPHWCLFPSNFCGNLDYRREWRELVGVSFDTWIWQRALLSLRWHFSFVLSTSPLCSISLSVCMSASVYPTKFDPSISICFLQFFYSFFVRSFLLSCLLHSFIYFSDLIDLLII